MCKAHQSLDYNQEPKKHDVPKQLLINFLQRMTESIIPCLHTANRLQQGWRQCTTARYHSAVIGVILVWAWSTQKYNRKCVWQTGTKNTKDSHKHGHSYLLQFTDTKNRFSWVVSNSHINRSRHFRSYWLLYPNWGSKEVHQSPLRLILKILG